MDYYRSNSVIFKKNKIIQAVMLVIMFELTFYPFPGYAKVDNFDLMGGKKEMIGGGVSINIQPILDEAVATPTPVIRIDLEKNIKTEPQKPAAKERKVAWSKRYVATAYNSEAAQCDSSPCITANGFNVCKHGVEDTVAANFLPFGTEIRMPELFGNRVFVVRDRMNRKYGNRIDVWLKDKDNAVDFGAKYPLVEVLK